MPSTPILYRLFARQAHHRASEEAIYDSAVSLRVALNDVVFLWHNNLRFASESTLKAYLLSINRVRGVKGDPLKKNALDLLEASQKVIDRGVTLWTSRTKS